MRCTQLTGNAAATRPRSSNRQSTPLLQTTARVPLTPANPIPPEPLPRRSRTPLPLIRMMRPVPGMRPNPRRRTRPAPTGHMPANIPVPAHTTVPI